MPYRGIGSGGPRQAAAPTSVVQPFPERHAPPIPDRALAMRGRIQKGILHKADLNLSLSTNGLFQIRTLIVDNISNQWIWCQEAQRFIYPWFRNVVIPLEGVGQITLQFLPPLSLTQASFAGAQPDSVFVTALENRWPPGDGVMIQAV